MTELGFSLSGVLLFGPFPILLCLLASQSSLLRREMRSYMNRLLRSRRSLVLRQHIEIEDDADERLIVDMFSLPQYARS